MMNKLMLSILVLLIIITGGIGYYSFTLNQRLDSLNERITEQSDHIQVVDDEINDLRVVTKNKLDSLDSQVTGARSDINDLTTGLASATDRITGAEEKIGAVASQITTFDERLASTEANVSGLADSIIDTEAVYEKAVRATVRITNGQITAGSGFIYDTEGHVVTAYHVVDSLPNIHIILYDGRISRAEVIGHCDVSDVAVLKLEDNPSIDPLPMGDSGKLRIGAPVVAIGSPVDSDDPLGLRDTLTSGIISQVNRYVNVDGRYIPNLLQFDTAVNFGNSGGPLLDASGQVVGVVNARIDPARGDGIYWAITSNKVKRVATAIIATGSFDYPWIGVGISDLTPEYVIDRSLETSNGALVSSVLSDGPAQDAGIQTGDIIVSIDGVAARNIADLTSYLGEFKSPGDNAVIEVMRGNNLLQLSVTVGTRPQ